MDYQTVKGTHDIILEEAEAYQAIEAVFISEAEVYNYHEFRTPIIEYSDLFKRNQNDSSDMVRKQMYTFNDLGGRSLSLRPEGTASIARTIVNNKLYALGDFPIKAYYLGPVFRYERPKAGTYRQFIQFGVENIGIDNEYNDVDTIALGFNCLKMLGFKNLKLKINTLGDLESRNAYKDALVKYFTPLADKMCKDCQERLKLNPLRIIDCKDPEDKPFIKGAPKISDYLNELSKSRFTKTLKLLENLGIPYEVDEGIVRGLDYYSHVVYEFVYTTQSGLNVGAIGGGGHYDNLIKEVGGPSLSGVGFACGLERIYALLKDENLLNNDLSKLDFFIIPIGENTFDYAMKVNYLLRNLGFHSDGVFEKKSLKASFKKALKYHSKYAILLGDDELNNKELVIKNLDSQEQTKIKFEQLQDYVDSLFDDDTHECHCHDNEEQK